MRKTSLLIAAAALAMAAISAPALAETDLTSGYSAPADGGSTGGLGGFSAAGQFSADDGVSGGPTAADGGGAAGEEGSGETSGDDGADGSDPGMGEPGVSGGHDDE